MYPTLYHFFFDQFGVEINFLRAVNSFGFFVALAFVVASWHLSKELRRKESQGLIPTSEKKVMVGQPASATELATNALIGFVLGYKLIYAFLNSEVFSDFPSFLFSSSGNIIGGLAGAVGMAYWVYREKEKEKKNPPEEKIEIVHAEHHVGPILMLAVVWGIIGAKLFAWLEEPVPLSEFLSDPFRGLTMYGGLICATIATTVYMRKKNIPVLQVYDAAAPGLILAYGIGRIGCHVAGDGDWGIVNTAPKPGWMSFLPDWFWAYNYPNNVNIEGVPMENCIYNDKYCNVLPETVFPTPFYETLMCLGIFGILLLVRKRINFAGGLFMVYLFFNGLERFLIEKIRVNVKYEFMGMEITQAEIISFAFMLIGILGFVWLWKRDQAKPSV